MTQDFYRIGVLYSLTFIVLWKIQQLKLLVQRIFNNKQAYSNDEARLQSLTLMIVGHSPKDYITSDIIGEFEAYANYQDIGNHKIIGCYHIPNLRKAYDLISDLKVTSVCHEICEEIELSDFSKKFIADKIKEKSLFKEYELQISNDVEKSVIEEAEKTGLSFICFKSADTMVRFIAFMKKLF